MSLAAVDDSILLIDSIKTTANAFTNKKWLQSIHPKSEPKTSCLYLDSSGALVTGKELFQALGRHYKTDLQQNPKRRRMVNIVRANWRSKVQRLHRHRSALLVEIETAEQANYNIGESLLLDYELLFVEPFAAKALVSRCFKCQLYGLVAFNCCNIAKCSICPGPAYPKDSPCALTRQSDRHRCAACSGNHKFGHTSCSDL